MAKKAAKKPRAKYTKKTKANRARALFSGMSQEELADKPTLVAACKKARLVIADSDIYRIRNEYLKGGTAPSTNGDDTLRHLLLVKKTAEQVGGLPALKHIVSMIERITQ